MRCCFFPCVQSGHLGPVYPGRGELNVSSHYCHYCNGNWWGGIHLYTIFFLAAVVLANHTLCWRSDKCKSEPSQSHLTIGSNDIILSIGTVQLLLRGVCPFEVWPMAVLLILLPRGLQRLAWMGGFKAKDKMMNLGHLNSGRFPGNWGVHSHRTCLWKYRYTS